MIPCLDVDGGRVVKGVNFQDLRDAGDPVELAALYDAAGRRRADLPRHLGLPRGPGDHAGDRLAARPSRSSSRSPSAGESPAPTTSTRCCGPAPTRSPSTPPPSTGPSWSPRSPTGSATRCWSCPSTPDVPPGTDSGFEVTTHGGRKSAGLDAVEWAARGPRARRRRDPAQRHGRRRHPGRLRPRADRGRTPRGHRPGDRQRWRRARPTTSPPAVEAGADAVLAASVFHFGTLSVGEVKAALAEAGHAVR